MSALRVSAVLCTHNPRAEPLARVLAALAQQTLPATDWELVVVDNASTPALAGRGFTFPANAVHVLEPELGLTPARLAGLARSGAPVIVLVDDDTVLAPDYLENAAQLFEAHPEVGAAGGRIRGEFGVPPRAWMSGHIDLLAIRDFGPRPIRALIHNEAGPWEPCGAGMVLRAGVARAYGARSASGQRRRLDRVGTRLTSCGDTDLARTAGDLGLQLAYEPSLSLTHLIPAGRLTLRYLVRLAYSVQRDGWLLYRLRGKRCEIAGWRLWLRRMLVPLQQFSPDPRRWLLRAASAYGQLHGRSIPMEAEHA